MKKIVFALFYLFLANTYAFGEDVIGFWKTINESTGKPESIVGIYEHNSKYFGRIVATLNSQGEIQDSMDNPKERAPGVIGNPFYSGMDIIWDLKKNGDKFSGGKILDPEHGRVYDAELWRDKNKLIVRGELLFLGRNQAWIPAENEDFNGFKKPNLTAFVPSIPEVKHYVSHLHHESHADE